MPLPFTTGVDCSFFLVYWLNKYSGNFCIFSHALFSILCFVPHHHKIAKNKPFPHIWRSSISPACSQDVRCKFSLEGWAVSDSLGPSLATHGSDSHFSSFDV